MRPKPHCGLMRNHFTSVFICGSFMITSAAARAQAKPPAPDGQKIDVISGRPVVDCVYLNGQGPFRFLIDTGAQTNQVELSIAQKIGLNPTFRSQITTAAGNALVPGGRVAEVALGPATASDQEFLFTGLDRVHQLSSGIQGVIGQEFLSRFDYLLDFSARRVVFGGVEPEGGFRTVFNLVDGRPAVETDMGQMVLDSGTALAVLYAASIGGSGGRLKTAFGSASMSQTFDLRFRVSGHAYSTTAVAVPRGSLKESGIIPASLFRSLYVNNSAKYLILNPATLSKR
jgi:hypothetical protein